MSDTSGPTGKKQARQRKAKHIAIGVGVTASVALAVLAIMAFLPRNSDGFVIQVDNPERTAKFNLKATKDGESTTYLKGDSLKKVWPSFAEEVDKHLDSFTDVDSISGSHNLLADGDKSDFQKALCYTVFLENPDKNNATPFRYSVDMDGYNSPKGSASIIEYLRFGIVTSTVTDGVSLNVDKKTIYYGASTLTEMGTVDGGVNDTREVLSTRTEVLDPSDESRERTLRKPVYVCPTGTGYAENFNAREGKGIVYDEASIPAGSTLRFTFVAYLEGYDPDCAGNLPLDGFLLFSLHFGI